MIKKRKINQDIYTLFNFKEIDKNTYLITNDFGYYEYISKKDLLKLINNKLEKNNKIYNKLSEKGFISNRLNFDDLYKNWKNKHESIYYGTGLHIFVMTLRCNHKCLYCQSSAIGENNKNVDMDIYAAKKSVDIALESPRGGITIEFQGGEPLLNWNVLKNTILYAKRKAKDKKKVLKLAIVTNFSTMDKQKAKFLIDNEVSICTSLDGPEKIHNKNRLYSNGNSYKETVKWINYFNKLSDFDIKGKKAFKPSALLTVTKFSLHHYKEIIDEYIKNNLDHIFLRPITPIGYAAKYWDKIGYTVEEFLDFYKKSLNYILDLNLKDKLFIEKTAVIFLQKILKSKDPKYLDLRSPCGASIGQMAYNYNGDIYTCDEGRMIGWLGNELFKIGNIKNKYEELIHNPVTKTVCFSSILETQHSCFKCVYKPYCGQCPVYNYATQNSIWGNMTSNYRCQLYTGILDYIFKLLKNDKYKSIFKKWMELYEDR